jgi:hypothetical protein
MTELPQAPWQQLLVDFCGPLPSGDMLFVVIDEYSRYPEVEIIIRFIEKTNLAVKD